MFRSSYGIMVWQDTHEQRTTLRQSLLLCFAESEKTFFSLKNNKSKYWLSKVVHAEVSPDSLLAFCFFPLFCLFILFLFLLLFDIF